MTRASIHVLRLSILATSDVHMHLLPHDYCGDHDTPAMGLETLAAAISDIRNDAAAEDPPRRVLLVDNGDMLQGNALGDHLAATQAPGQPHPVALVMNAMGYAAMGLGNHDLDYGLEYLAGFARSLDAPLISSNTVLDPARDWLAPHALIDAGDVTVGVLSVLPPRTIRALHAQLGNSVAVGDMVDAVKRTARHLTDAGADIVLGLGHTGINPEDPDEALEDIAATGLLDALVGGHDHTIFPGPDHAELAGASADMEAGTLHGVPTVMPGFSGALLGRIDLDLERAPQGRWVVTRGTARTLAPAPVQTGAGCSFDAIRPAHDATRADLDRVAARTSIPLNSYFAQVTPTPIHALTAAAQRMAIEEARADTSLARLPLLSAVSLPRAGGIGGSWNYTDIPAGPLKVRHLADLCIYANYVWAVQVSGAEIAEWLEKSASAFALLCAHGKAGLFDVSFPAFDFDVIHGLDYTIDPTVPARYDRAGNLRHPQSRRIQSLNHDGAPVADDAQYLVAASSFRACGGGNFPGLHPDRPVLRPERLTSDAIRAFLDSGAEPPDPASWRFAQSCAGTTTWFETGPGALDHLGDIAHLSPGTPERRPSGFVRIPITL